MNKTETLTILLTIAIAGSVAYGSGLFGSGEPDPVMKAFYREQWRTMNRSEPKNEARALFNERKFGMFIHWGLYALPGGVWKGQKMEEGGEGPRSAEWIMRNKSIPRDEYAQLAVQFNPEKFDAAEWVEIAKAAGMRYMVITSKHHDGFALFQSEASKFNVVDGTPFGRDIIAELAEACEEAGIAFGVYYSNALDWFDGGDSGVADYGEEPLRYQGRVFPNRWDPSPRSFSEYIAEKSLPQVRELIGRHDLATIWLDTPLYLPAKYSFVFYKTIYDANPRILVNSRVGNNMGDILTPRDNVLPEFVEQSCWETIATMNNSWGYKSYDDDWKSPQEVLYWLVSSVSKGGNFLLNVGPTAEGVIPQESVDCLLAVGRWLKRNGEAIYGTQPWTTRYEGPGEWLPNRHDSRATEGFAFKPSENEFWFTQNDKKIYAISFKFPEDGTARLKSLSGVMPTSVRILGGESGLSFAVAEEGLEVQLPDCFREFENGFVLEIKP